LSSMDRDSPLGLLAGRLAYLDQEKRRPQPA
jgi:hypothetical protein